MNKCLNCGKELTNKWQKKFCSRSCSATYNNEKYPKRGDGELKYCKNCGIELKNKKRKNIFYCSPECFQEYRVKNYIKKWLKKEIKGDVKYGGLSKTIRDYLIKKSNYACSLCGWDKVNKVTGVCPLEIDHIDGNHKNNSPENLQVVCPNCHSLTATYKVLNKGNGREYRKNK